MHDYNERRSLIIDITERLEGGNYFSFIDNVKDELTDQFGDFKMINTSMHSACISIKSIKVKAL